jgi:hypothetical protein
MNHQNKHNLAKTLLAIVWIGEKDFKEQVNY